MATPIIDPESEFDNTEYNKAKKELKKLYPVLDYEESNLHILDGVPKREDIQINTPLSPLLKEGDDVFGIIQDVSLTDENIIDYARSRKSLDRSIKGLQGLSNEEFNKWRLDNWDLTEGKSYTELEDIYWNQAYDALNRYRLSTYPTAQQQIIKELESGKSPKELFTEYQVNKGTAEFRKSLADTNTMMQFDSLSPEYKLEVANSYLSDIDITRAAKEYVESGKLIDELDPGFWGQIGHLGKTLGKGALAGGLLGPLGAGAVGFGESGHYSKDPLLTALKSEREDMVNQYITDLEARNAEILEKAVQKDTEKKIDLHANDINNTTIALTKALSEGKISNSDIDEQFNKIAEQSPYYKAFKDSNEFDSFDYADKIRTISQYSTMANSVGEVAAFNALNRDMQNWVDEHQSIGENLVNCLFGFLSEAASSMGSSLIGTLSLFKDRNFLEGKDSEGNKLPLIFDINYWNDISQYNTVLPSLIEEIKANGGISPHVNVTAYGEELDFLSWDALGQAIEQSGQFAGMSFNKGIAKVVKFPVKYPLSKVIKSKGLRKLGSGLDELIDMAWVSAGPAMKESFEAYQNTKETATRELDKRKEAEYLSEVNKINKSFNWGVSIGEADLYVKDLRKLEINRNKSDKELYDFAFKAISEKKQQDYNTLTQGIKARIDSKYEEDYTKIPEFASTAYKTAFGINIIKTSITNATSRKWLFNNKAADKIKRTVGYKGKKVPFDSNKKTWNELSAWGKTKVVAKKAYETYKTEALDEGADYLINQYGYHTGMSKFDNYISDKYSTSNYITGVNWLSGILSNLGKTYNHLEDRELWYEAYLGGLGGTMNFTPNLDMFSRGFSTYTRAEKKLKEKGVPVELSTIEKLNRWVNNGIISSIAEDDNDIKDRRRIAGLVSGLLKENKDFEHVIGLLGSAVEEVDAEQNGGVKEVKDSRINSAIKLAFALHNAKSLLEDANMEETPYEDMITEIKELAAGNVSEEMITKFLSTPENRTVVSLGKDGNYTEETINSAKERLIHNAKKLDAIITKVNTTYRQEAERVADEENIPDDVREDYINTHIQIRAKMDDAKGRIESLTKELDLQENPSMHSEQYIRNRNKAYQSERSKLLENIEKSKTKIEILKSKLKKTFKSNSRKEIKQEIEKESSKIDIFNLDLSKLDDSINPEEQSVSEITGEVLSNLPKEEVLFIVDSKNQKLFSTKEQKEIQKFIKEMQSKDAEYFTKLQDLKDLSDEYTAMNEGIDNFSSNSSFMVDYINAYKQKRFNEYLKVTKELLYENFSTYVQTLQKENPSLAKSFLRKYGTSNFLTRFIEENPEDGGAYKELIDILIAKEDIISILKDMDVPSETKNVIKGILSDKVQKAKSKNNLLNNLEKLAQADNDLSPFFNEILFKLEDIGYTRNATVIESAEKKRERKKKQEEKRKKQEEKKKKKEKQEDQEKSEEKAQESSEEITISESIEIEELSSNEVEGAAQEETPEVISTQDIDITESPTIEEQVVSVEEEHKDKVTLREVNDEDIAPVEVLQSSEILGNAMYEYEGAASSTGTQKRRRGKKEDDRMSKFFDWTKAAGFTIQKTIDEELLRISSTNPDVMFMAVNPVSNATKDADVEGHIFTVVEYTPKIKRIHTSEDGNVITAGDKKYLVIGTLGYADSNFTQKNLAGFVWSNITNSSKAYFKNNSSQRFYVDSTLKTKISGIDRGWLVNQLEEDNSVKPRSIIELINDPKRNPRKLKIEDLKWRIQIGDRAADTNVTEDDIVGSFKSEKEQSGRTFLLVESSNGKYIPVAVRPVFFKEINEGTLKDTIVDLASKLASGIPSEADRAYKELRTKLVFNKDRKLVLNGNIIEEHFNGSVVRSFDVTSPSFSIVDLLGVLDNFRINITAPSLTSKVSITELANAGALNLDIATLSTSNAGYKLYGIDPDTRQPIISSNTDSSNSVDTSGDKFVLKDQKITHNGAEYTSKESGFYDKNGNLVRDPYFIEMLKIESIIKDTNPVKVNRDTEYYVLKYNNGDTFMVSRNIKTGIVVKVQASTKDRILNEIKEEERKNNAAQELKASEQVQKTQDQIVTADESDITLLGDILFEEEEVTPVKSEEVKPAQSTTQESVENKPKNKSLEELKEDSASLDTVEKIIDDAIFGEELDSIIDEKVSSGQWPGVNSVDDLKSFLESKGMPIIGITNVRLWLDIIKECK